MGNRTKNPIFDFFKKVKQYLCVKVEKLAQYSKNRQKSFFNGEREGVEGSATLNTGDIPIF